MNKWELFQKFLITENSQIDIQTLIINSVLVLVLTTILEFTYRKCARSLSNKTIFANNFLLITFTTMVIIAIVKTSLALSLGLVGALSIVRFRAAIKEPEELAYIFFTISIGLGLGAEQIGLVVVSFVIVMIFIWGRYLLSKRDHTRNLYLSIRSDKGPLDLNVLQSFVDSSFKKNSLKRLDELDGRAEVSYHVDVKSADDVFAFKQGLAEKLPQAEVAFIDIEV